MSVIIVGGGITGSTLALAISNLTCSTLLIHLVESLIPQSQDHSECDVRAIVLAHGTCKKLENIGIWEKISKYATQIHNIHVRYCSYTDYVDFKARDYHISSLGQVIELNKVRFKLFQLLTIAPNIVLHCPARVINIIRSNTDVSAILDNGKVLNSKLLIAANGSHPTLVSKCGITWQKKLYNQIAIVSNIKTTNNNYTGHAWECFTKHGSIAILPISNERYFLVWCFTKKEASNIINSSNNHFCSEIQKVFGYRLGRIIYADRRSVHPLALITATRFISHRIVLVGNAAQTLHPIIGQGFNLALRDAMSLAELIAQACIEQKDYGSYSMLDYYQRKRQLDKEITINMTDGLVNLFSNQCTLLVVGRKLGLITMGLFVPVRNILARRALGWVPY